MAEDSKNIYQRLAVVQSQVVAPKQEGGRFGKARSAEQILEVLKPLCKKHGLYLYTTDDIEEHNGRNYIVATATVVNVDKPEETHGASAAAWEGEVDRGLDASQVTGKTSSYAKKYALQNLFAIDDTKDADHDDEPSSSPSASTNASDMATDTQKSKIVELLRALGVKVGDIPGVLRDDYQITDTTKMTMAQAIRIIDALEARRSS